MKTHLALSLILALFASTILPSCSAGGSANANVGGIAKVSASGSGHARRR
ncbi:MAG: hypothetical protein ACO1TE_25980 [Prosthecobacter sp.]